MKKLIKKAFTLVELLVVLAILAALATVGILSYSAYTKKANNASDNTLLAQLNHTLLLMDEEPKTYYEMRKYLDDEIGYQIDRISTFSKNCKYAWNIDENKLYLVENGERIIAPAGEEKEFKTAEEKHRYYVPIDSDSEVETNGKYHDFACYLRKDATATDGLITNAGVDCGYNTNVTEVKYLNNDAEPQNTIIRTNSYATSLIVDAPNDTVKHYGEVGHVNIVAVADHSYIEYGNGAIVQVKDGHVEITKDADIAYIHITKKDDKEEFDDVEITIEDGASLPQLSRDSITLSEGSEVKVCTVTTTEKSEDVILTKKGIVEQIILQEKVNDTTRYADYVENPIESQDDKQNSAANMLANVLNGFSRNETTGAIEPKKDGAVTIIFDSTSHDFKAENGTTEQQAAALNAVVSTDTGKNSTDVIDNALAEIFGDVWDGTSNTNWYSDSKNEFVIKTAEELAGFANLVNEGKTFEGKTVKLGNDIDLNNLVWTGIGWPGELVPSWFDYYSSSKTFMGTFDGDGHTIRNLFLTSEVEHGATSLRFLGFFYSLTNATVKNIIFDTATLESGGGCHDEWEYYCEKAVIAGQTHGDTIIDNVIVKNSFGETYNWPVAGIVAMVQDGTTTVKNVNLDDSNVYRAQWGSYDSVVGGLVGVLHSGAHLNVDNCTVACKLDAYNDCNGNYQWYVYRYVGMICGVVEGKNSTNVSDVVTITNTEVIFDTWCLFEYCEWQGLGKGSYNAEDEYKLGRINEVDRSYNNYGAPETHVHLSEEDQHCWLIPMYNIFGLGTGNGRIASTSETIQKNDSVYEDITTVTGLKIIFKNGSEPKED